MIIHSANDAPARLTKDSSASDSSPTEPVIHHAKALKAMVEMAAAIDSHAKWWRSMPVLPVIAQPRSTSVTPFTSRIRVSARWICCTPCTSRVKRIRADPLRLRVFTAITLSFSFESTSEMSRRRP